MEFQQLKCVSDDINVDDYLSLYQQVHEKMEHPEWLGTFSKEEVLSLLQSGGKIWLYYDGEKPVASFFYLPVPQKSLNKHHASSLAEETGSLGPIMVHPDYVGHGFQREMMKVLDAYCLGIGKKYLFTKAHHDNIYSCQNFLKDGYQLIDTYQNERGVNDAFLKTL